jgi:Na+/melibiose symporter-like transporter
MAIKDRANKKNDDSMGTTDENPSVNHDDVTQLAWKEPYDRHQNSIDIIMKTVNTYSKEMEKVHKVIEKQNKKITENEQKFKEIESSIKNVELRSIEVIGIISAIIALVLTFVVTARSEASLKDSYAILITGASSLVIFASLIHHFFNKDDKRSIWYYVLSIVIPLLIIFLIGLSIFRDNPTNPSQANIQNKSISISVEKK